MLCWSSNVDGAMQLLILIYEYNQTDSVHALPAGSVVAVYKYLSAIQFGTRYYDILYNHLVLW